MSGEDIGPVLPGPGDSDYERYLRTDELLSLQTRPEDRVHRDELLFQTVHQSSELWLKLALQEVEEATRLIDADALLAAGRFVRRAVLCLRQVTDALDMLDLLDPWGDWPVWMQRSAVIPDEERPAYVKPEFLNKVSDFDPIKLLPALKTPHIRLNQLDDDFASTPEEAKKQMEAALPARAEHRRFETSMAFYGEVASGGRVFDWLKLQIKTADSKVREATREALPGAGPGSGK